MAIMIACTRHRMMFFDDSNRILTHARARAIWNRRRMLFYDSNGLLTHARARALLE